MTYNIYTGLCICLRLKIVSMTKPFLFHRKTRVWGKLLLLYINGRFYKKLYLFSFRYNLYILTIKTTYRHIKCTFNHLGYCRTLISRELLQLPLVACQGKTVWNFFQKDIPRLCGWDVLTVFNITPDNQSGLSM